MLLHAYKACFMGIFFNAQLVVSQVLREDVIDIESACPIVVPLTCDLACGLRFSACQLDPLQSSQVI